MQCLLMHPQGLTEPLEYVFVEEEILYTDKEQTKKKKKKLKIMQSTVDCFSLYIYVEVYFTGGAVIPPSNCGWSVIVLAYTVN